MIDVIAERDGVLYVRAQYHELSEPVLRTYWWPTGAKAAVFKMNYPNAADRLPFPVSKRNSGEYVDSFRIVYRLEHGGDTRATWIEETPVPCPKVRRGIATRYDRGRWEKFLTREGWVPILLVGGIERGDPSHSDPPRA